MREVRCTGCGLSFEADEKTSNQLSILRCTGAARGANQPGVRNRVPSHERRGAGRLHRKQCMDGRLTPGQVRRRVTPVKGTGGQTDGQSA